MARRKRRRGGSHDEHAANHERWLLTYADLITLLLALFVVLYSMSSINISEYNAMMESFGEVLGSNEPPPPETSGTTPVSEEAETQPPAGEPTEEELDQQMEELVAQVNQAIEDHNYQDKISLIKGDNYILFQFTDNVFFYPDSAEFKDEAYPILDFVAQVLIELEPYTSSVEITGHTADDGEKVSNTFAMQLSTDRAIAVFDYLVSAGVNESTMYVVGKGSNVPIASNDTEEGRAQNRRVEIKVTNNFE